MTLKYLRACRFWSKLNGDDELTWGPDALLTPTGKAQALDARAAWEAELEFGVPTPHKFYSSPLRRALDTWAGTFAGESAILPEEKRRVLILEVTINFTLRFRVSIDRFGIQNCREEYGEHTCDLRSTLSTLRTIYPPPVYSFEPGFNEDDPVWKPDEREAKTHITARATDVLNTVFVEPFTCTVTKFYQARIHNMLNVSSSRYLNNLTWGFHQRVLERHWATLLCVTNWRWVLSFLSHELWIAPCC